MVELIWYYDHFIYGVKWLGIYGFVNQQGLDSMRY